MNIWKFYIGQSGTNRMTGDTRKMGTRADFYIGKRSDLQNVEWLGSIAWDGYPDGNPSLLNRTEHLESQYIGYGHSDFSIEEYENNYMKNLMDLQKECHDEFTTPENGWPWPWDSSRTTDYAYLFDREDGKVYISGFGSEFYTFEQSEDEDFMEEFYENRGNEDKVKWPKMDTSSPAVGSNKSGVITISSDSQGNMRVD